MPDTKEPEGAAPKPGSLRDMFAKQAQRAREQQAEIDRKKSEQLPGVRRRP